MKTHLQVIALLHEGSEGLVHELFVLNERGKSDCSRRKGGLYLFKPAELLQPLYPISLGSFPVCRIGKPLDGARMQGDAAIIRPVADLGLIRTW